MYHELQERLKCKNVPLARTTFNPDFDFIMQQYDEMFAGHGQ